MNTIVIMYDPFAMESRISLVQEGQREQVSVASNIEELADATVSFAYNHGTNDIRVHAPLAVYGEIKRAIEAVEKNQYNKNSLNVGVI